MDLYQTFFPLRWPIRSVGNGCHLFISWSAFCGTDEPLLRNNCKYFTQILVVTCNIDMLKFKFHPNLAVFGFLAMVSNMFKFNQWCLFFVRFYIYYILLHLVLADIQDG